MFWNYENDIHAYIKLREKEDYLKTKVELKLFEWKLDFWNLFENWSPEDYLIIGALGIEFKNGKKKLEFFLKGFENWCLEN